MTVSKCYHGDQPPYILKLKMIITKTDYHKYPQFGYLALQLLSPHCLVESHGMNLLPDVISTECKELPSPAIKALTITTT